MSRATLFVATLFAPIATTALLSAVPATARAGQVFVQQNNGTVSEYDATTGATINASFITGLGGSNVQGIAASGGDLFFSIPDEGTVAEYNATTGAVIDRTLVSGVTGMYGPFAVAGGDLFVQQNNGTVSEYDATTGATINASFITGLGGSNVQGIAASGGDLFFSIPDEGTVAEYNATTGAVIDRTLVSGVTGMYGPFAVVTPEPSTWVMFVIGAAALVACAIRNRRSPVARERAAATGPTSCI